MIISLDWIKDYVEVDLSGEEIGEILSDRGFPIEEIVDVGGDLAIDVEVTSNRGDCLSHIGLARELAAALGKELKLPALELNESVQKTDEFVDVMIDVPELSHRYTVRVISGVKVGPSPEWLKKRIEAIGLRSVNNVVDVSNYVMMETGQPSHTFDYDKLAGKKIVVRKGIKGERLVSIDGTKCDLDENTLTIADGDKAVAIAGVMGGLDTEVSETTTTVLLEVAHFDPVSVRTSSRKLVLGSDASFRFERHVDTANMDWVSSRLASMIAKVSGGQVAAGLVDAYPVKQEPAVATMRLSRMRALLGIEIPVDFVMSAFASLGFNPVRQGDDVIECTSPSWRHDVYREVDLIEEAARSYGFDKIPVEPKIHIEVATPDPFQKTAAKVREVLNGCGFYETLNVTFTSSRLAELFADNAPDAHMAVNDSSQRSANLLRQNLLGQLVTNIQTNHNMGNVPCQVYELADTFVTTAGHKSGELPDEHMKVAMGMDGDFRQLRGVLEEVVGAVALDSTLEIVPCEVKWAQAGARLLLDGQAFGVAGILKAEIAGEFNLDKQMISMCEFDFGMLMDKAGAIPTAKPLPRFPAIVRDLSLIVDEPVSWADVRGVIDAQDIAILEEVQFGGLYRGKPIAKGQKSVTVSLCFRDDQGTLTHDAVDEFDTQIVTALKEKLGAELRTA